MADNSNLTLDPQLDSFYAMNAVTVHLPDLMAMGARLKNAEAMPASMPARAEAVSMAVERLQVAAEAADQSIDTSIRSDSTGHAGPALARRAPSCRASPAG